MPPFDQTDLQQTFLRLVDLFNAGDYGDMLPLLDPDITWKMLHHASSVTGANSVLQWLTRNKALSNPQFIPDLASERTSPPSPGDGSRQISGPAEWQAQKAGPNEGIDFNFTFTTDKASRWRLIHAFATLR